MDDKSCEKRLGTYSIIPSGKRGKAFQIPKAAVDAFGLELKQEVVVTMDDKSITYTPAEKGPV